jgi:hypothetical protein
MLERLRNQIRGVNSQRIIGVLLIGFCVFMILTASGLVPSDTDLNDVPLWVVIPAYGMFLSVGVFLLLQNTRLESQGGLIAAGGIVFGLGVILNWGAFGPGYRECTRTVSLPVVAVGGEASDLECRVVIGYFAAIFDAILVIVLASRMAATFGDHLWTRAFLYFGYGVLGLVLLPLLLLIAVVVLVTGSTDKIKPLLKKMFRGKDTPGTS